MDCPERAHGQCPFAIGHERLRHDFLFIALWLCSFLFLIAGLIFWDGCLNDPKMSASISAKISCALCLMASQVLGCWGSYLAFCKRTTLHEALHGYWWTGDLVISSCAPIFECSIQRASTLPFVRNDTALLLPGSISSFSCWKLGFVGLQTQNATKHIRQVCEYSLLALLLKGIVELREAEVSFRLFGWCFWKTSRYLLATIPSHDDATHNQIETSLEVHMLELARKWSTQGGLPSWQQVPFTYNWIRSVFEQNQHMPEQWLYQKILVDAEQLGYIIKIQHRANLRRYELSFAYANQIRNEAQLLTMAWQGFQSAYPHAARTLQREIKNAIRSRQLSEGGGGGI
jgi:hypothetical protein